jgi:hypothetical protein
VRAAGVVLRSLFLIILIVMVARVAAPQHVGRTWYDIPRPGADAARFRDCDLVKLPPNLRSSVKRAI